MACKLWPLLHLFFSWSCERELFPFPLLCTAQIACGSFMDYGSLAAGNNRNLSYFIFLFILFIFLNFFCISRGGLAEVKKSFKHFWTKCWLLFLSVALFSCQICVLTNAVLFLVELQLLVQTDDIMKALDKYNNYTSSVNLIPLTLNVHLIDICRFLPSGF